MITVRLAQPTDITDLLVLIYEIQKHHQVGLDQKINDESFCMWIADCIFSPGIYVFVAEENDCIEGLMVLNEVACPWNNDVRSGTDLLFCALKGGNKLIRTAKALAKKKNWDKLIFTTSLSNERADQYFETFSKKIGGVYEVEI